MFTVAGGIGRVEYRAVCGVSTAVWHRSDTGVVGLKLTQSLAITFVL
jgi:hypothetical protein